MTSCRLISGGEAFDGKQGLSYFSGISAESAGSEKLCMHIVTIPPGASARPNLEYVMVIKAGDFCYIPAGVPHQPYNPTDKPVRAVIARTDPNEQESVVLLD